MAANATELFLAMHDAIKRCGYPRTSGDAASPQRGDTAEAIPGSQFVLDHPLHNSVACRAYDRRWAIANLLHFFAATEEAGPLRTYNRRADKFLTGDRWIGAYGAAMMPQVEACIRMLRADPSTRRAICTMGSAAAEQDANRPQCWNLLHFLEYRGRLDLLLHQRSLNLANVFAYDAIVVTNVHAYVAAMSGLPIGQLRWTISSCHWPETEEFNVSVDGPRTESLILPPSLLSSPGACWAELCNPGMLWYGRLLCGTSN